VKPGGISVGMVWVTWWGKASVAPSVCYVGGAGAWAVRYIQCNTQVQWVCYNISKSISRLKNVDGKADRGTEWCGNF